MSPTADEPDGNALTPLRQFRSVSETEIVIGLLQSKGIPAICAGRYNPKAPAQILVPARCVEEAKRLIADAHDVTSGSEHAAERRVAEPRSLVTVITWVLAFGILLLVIVEVWRFVEGIVKGFFR